MPTLSTGMALLNVTAALRLESNGADPDAPWSWPAWQEYMGCTRPPWHAHEPGEEHIFGWDSGEIAAAAEYINAYCKKVSMAAKRDFTKVPNVDEHVAGRRLVNTAFASIWKEFDIAEVVRTVLASQEKDLYGLVRTHGSRKVCAFRGRSLVFSHEYQLPEIKTEELGPTKRIVIRQLFGNDGFKPESRFRVPKTPCIFLLDAWLATIWQAHNHKLHRDNRLIAKLEQEVEKALSGKIIRGIYVNLSIILRVTDFQGKSRNLQTLRAFLAKSAKVMSIYKQYSDERAVTQIEEHLKQLEGIREMLSLSPDGAITSRRCLSSL